MKQETKKTAIITCSSRDIGKDIQPMGIFGEIHFIEAETVNRSILLIESNLLS
jgi:hypothetical protein